MTKTKTPPPGTKGLPLIGRTWDFLKDPFGLIQQGAETHGSVFMTSVLGEDMVFLTGPEACELWLNPELIERRKAQPPHVKNIFGTENMLPLLDDTAHQLRRKFVLEGFTREALASYLPDLQATLEARFQQWLTAKQPLAGVLALKRLAVEAISRNMIGLEPGPELETLIARYIQTDGALTCIPVPLPGTIYSQMLKAVKEIMAFLKQIGQERRLNPSHDAYSRILSARNEAGQSLGIEEASYEIHHCILGGYIIWGELVMIMKHLIVKPDLRKMLEAEVQQLSPQGPVQAKDLAKMKHLLNFVQEVKRLTPIVPGQFARARKDFTFQGYTITKGVRVFLGMYTTNQDPAIYPNPETFDPERFAEERAEHQKHPHAFVPQGPGGDHSHRCPGLDYATLIMQVFTLVLLRGYDWQLPEQNLAYNWRVIPPEPKAGFQFLWRKKEKN